MGICRGSQTCSYLKRRDAASQQRAGSSWADIYMGAAARARARARERETQEERQRAGRQFVGSYIYMGAAARARASERRRKRDRERSGLCIVGCWNVYHNHTSYLIPVHNIYTTDQRGTRTPTRSGQVVFLRKQRQETRLKAQTRGPKALDAPPGDGVLEPFYRVCLLL